MRPELCKTKTESETKNYEIETKTSPAKSTACESNTNRYVLFLVTHVK